MLERDVGAIGALDFPPAVRRELAKKSVVHICPKCKIPNSDLLSPLVVSDDEDDGVRGDGEKDETPSCSQESPSGESLASASLSASASSLSSPVATHSAESERGNTIHQRRISFGEVIHHPSDTEQTQDVMTTRTPGEEKREKINILLQWTFVTWIIAALYRVLFV
jgi:hypothetical protein